MITDKSITKKTQQIKARIPRISNARAHDKAESTEVGKAGVLVGLVLCLGSAAVLVIVSIIAEITLLVVAGVGVIGLLGLLVLFFSATLISRDAEPVVGKIGEFIVQAIRELRK